MPWDNTMLHVQTLDETLKPVGDPTLIRGGEASVAVPRWTPSGSLVFLSDHDGWYNLYEYKQEGVPLAALCPKEADFCSGGQGWILGLCPFAVMPNGSIVSAYTDTDDGGSKLGIITPQEGSSSAKIQEFGRSSVPPTSISSFCATQSNGLYFVGGSTKEPPAIWFWEKPGIGKAQMVLPSMDSSVDLKPLQAAMSEPRLVQFPSGDGRAFGYFYPPTNLSPDLGSDFKPPLLVKVGVKSTWVLLWSIPLVQTVVGDLSLFCELVAHIDFVSIFRLTVDPRLKPRQYFGWRFSSGPVAALLCWTSTMAEALGMERR